ncbi:MAG TPA: hypothetical protein VFB21_16790 [Chthonomonadaceae bacterium]|nr:hypothetical protein [Chthonomonadaceae bacterium]
MKLLELFGKEKPLPFAKFRELVRAAVRQHDPDLKIQNTENGFILISDAAPVACNLRNLHAAYCKTPGDCDALIRAWLKSLVTTPPEHTWLEARATLRPMLKDAEYLRHARAQMLKSPSPDSLPYQPFVGELFAIVVRDLPGTAVAVTEKQLEAWGVSFAKAMEEALNNMNLLSFPPILHSLLAGSATPRAPEETQVVGLVFHGDHLTATWLLIERFRDHISQRLHSDYVVFVPNRSQLTAVRVDEPGLITSILYSNQNYRSQPHALTAQCFHVSTATTGGVVSVYQVGGMGDSLAPNSPFASGASAPQSAPSAPVSSRAAAPRALNDWWGLNEPTEEGS